MKFKQFFFALFDMKRTVRLFKIQKLTLKFMYIE